MNATSLTTVALLLALVRPVSAQEKVFSGPQAGEKLTTFRVLRITGPEAGREAMLPGEGGAVALVFVHALERSMVPLMRVVDQYGARQSAKLKTVFVVLSEDRVASEQRLPLVGQSLRLRSPLTLSLDGIEGPGNYGLNRKCLLTILIAVEGRVAANFALVQPGVADAPAVIAALARAAGDANPPTAEALLAADGPMAPPRRPVPPPARSFDLSRFDLNTQEGLREAVRALAGEVQALRRELAQVSSQDGRARGPGQREDPVARAVPADGRLAELFRAFIRPGIDDATVDRIAQEVDVYVKANPGLRKQAVEAWTRVMELKYGTPHAQRVSRELVLVLDR